MNDRLQTTAQTAQQPQDPFSLITDMVMNIVSSHALLVATDLGVAEALGDGEETAASLARKIGANADKLSRILRLLASKGIFEQRGDKFRNTPTSVLLRKDHPQSMRGLVRAIHTGAPVLAHLEHAVRTGRPAAEMVDPDGLWVWLAKNPELGRAFDDAMVSKSVTTIPAIVAAYDFSRFSTIADIGGGKGHLIKAVLDATPKARGILFDLPQVVERAKGAASSRLTIQGGDLFKDRLPAADAYLLMNVIHDWSDEESVAILKAVRKAASVQSRLLLMETPLPESGQADLPLAVDILMMAYASGRERKLSEYQTLLAASGWRFERAIDAAGGAIIESSPA